MNVFHVGKWKGVVVPRMPRIEKYFAMAILLEQVTGALELPKDWEIVYWAVNDDPPSAEAAKWNERKLYPIGIGHKKYTVAGKGSDTYILVEDLKLNLNHMPEVAGLVNLSVRNNATGFLKEQADGFNIAFLLVEAWRACMGFHAAMITEAALHSVFTHIRFRRMVERRLPYERWMQDLQKFPKLLELFLALPDLPIVEPGGKPVREHFTLREYLLQMFCLGDDPDMIKVRIEFWLRVYKRQKEMRGVWKAKGKEIEKTEFSVSGHRAIHIIVDDDGVARAIFSRRGAPSIILCESRRGNYVIMTSKVLWHNPQVVESLQKLTQVLQARAINAKWQKHPALQTIFNGSRPLRDSIPAGIRRGPLMELISATVILPPPTPLQIKQWQKARVEALQIPAEAEQEAAKPEPETVPQ